MENFILGRKFIGFVGKEFEGYKILDVIPYFDLSTDQEELAFVTNKGNINVDLFLEKYVIE